MSSLIRPRGVPMRSISIPYLFTATSTLERLRLLPQDGASIEEIAPVLAQARMQMVDLHNPELLYALPLRSAFQSAEFLAEVLLKQTEDLTPGRKVSADEIGAIQRLYEQYRAALLGALSAMGMFLVTQKGPYEVRTLLIEGDKLYPEDLKDKVQEAIYDAQQAGKCLAYDVPTACGFHAFRVTESVVRRYWTLVTGGLLHLKFAHLEYICRPLLASVSVIARLLPL